MDSRLRRPPVRSLKANEMDNEIEWCEEAIVANLFFIIILNVSVRLEKKGKSQLKSECHSTVFFHSFHLLR